MVEPGLKITIIGDSTGQSCSGNCGGDWSLPEAVNNARQRVIERFGERVELEYIDLPKATDSADIRRIKVIIQDMLLPVLLANDRPRIAGGFDMRQLMDVIEVSLEVGV